MSHPANFSWYSQSESVLIQKIYTHFKKAPGTHKLGVLYVVDSVTRSWVEQARKAGQQPAASAPYGTYGAGVYRVTELLPMLMTDIVNSAPEDQKVRSKGRKLRARYNLIEGLPFPVLVDWDCVVVCPYTFPRMHS